MINVIKKELINRIIILMICILIITLITIQYSNDIILWILNPIKQSNQDFHNKLIYNIIHNSFNSFDTEKKKVVITDINIKIDYIPSYEISIDREKIYKITRNIIIHINCIILALIIYKNLILLSLPSTFKEEKKKIIHNYVKYVATIITGILYTQKVWTQIYFNISLHNYYEYNYYEIDILFDINNYINQYIKTIYITIAIIIIKKKEFVMWFIIIIWLLEILNNIESIYMCLIWLKKKNINEKKKKIHIMKNNMLLNLNKMEKQKKMYF